MRFIVLLITFFLFYSPDAYTQEANVAQEIKAAIENFSQEKYDQAIPVLEKYAEGKGLDEFTNLSVTVYLNCYYLLNKKDKFDVAKVNGLTDQYFDKRGITKSDPLKADEEIDLLYLVAMINGNVENYEKKVADLIVIKKHCEVNNNITNQFYISVLYEMAESYFGLSNHALAIENGLYALKLNTDFFGEKNETSLKILKVLCTCYYKTNELEKAFEFLQKWVTIAKELLGEKKPEYLAQLNGLGFLNMTLGKYYQAQKIFLQVVALQKEVLGEKDPDYLTSLNNLAQCYSNLGNYSNALEINLQVVSLGKVVLGERHPDYLTYLSNLASIYCYLGNYSKALEIDLQVVSMGKEVLGERHPDYLSSLNDLAVVYSNLGNYSKALEIDLQVVSLRKEVLGERHPDYLMSLGNIASVYSNLGNYSNALEINLLAVLRLKEILGERHSDYLTGLSNLASTYSYLGNFSKALEINLQVISLKKEVLGERHPDYLTSLSNLASTYSDLGNYSKALEINLQVVSLRKEVLGERHPNYLKSLNNLARDYFYLGNYSKALEINLLFISIMKEVYGERHPDYLTCLSNLANDYSSLGNYSKSLEINLHLVSLRKEILGERHPYYLRSLNNLAVDYSNLGNYSKSLEINLKTVLIRKEDLGERHPDYLTSLGNLADNYSSLGNYSKALEIDLQVVSLGKEVLGEQHPHYLTGLSNLSINEYSLSNFDDASNHRKEWIYQAKSMVTRYFAGMTEQQRSLFWEMYRQDFEYTPMFLSAATKAPSDSLTGEIYNVALFTKGSLLNTTRDFGELLAEKGSPEAIAKFEELKNLQLQIQRLEEKPIAERLMNVDSLQTIAQQKETELVKLSQEYGDYTRNLKITWQEVQSKLQDKEVAIEFVAYPTLTDTVRYAALVVRKGWSTPRMIPLFTKDQMDEFLSQDKDKIYSSGYVGKQIRKLCWDPLKEVIAEGETVYFSASGLLHQLAIEHLMVNETQTLGDLYQMHRLSTTKELVFTKPRANTHSGVLYGGLRYDLPTSEMVIESKKYKTENNAYYAMRGYRSDSTLRKGWGFLEATLPEVEKIGLLMKEQKYTHTLYTGNLGNEESFKALSGKQEGIIHIATHGFFLPVEESRKNKFMLQRMGETPTYNAKADPMMRAGLLFAGGNKAWLGDTIPQGIEDGVLTAKEISHLDLRGTDMVVLSACETGLGDVSSEGVFGLQRAFKQAGVQTLVMSLWEVDDKATQLMMTSFYKNLMLGESKREAFLIAQKKCRETYPDPRYWAAFILLD